MEQSTRDTIEQCASSAHDGSAAFPAIVAALSHAGVEAYQADYRRGFITYYLPSGETHSTALHVPDIAIPTPFDAAALQAVIRGSQRGEVAYPMFLVRSVTAGCVGYVVWITGRNVTYFGRAGEVHVERFPSVP